MMDMPVCLSAVAFMLPVQRGIRNKKKKPKNQNTAWIMKYAMFIDSCADYMRLACPAQTCRG